MLAALYTYGHLFTASLSAAIALAFLSLGLRVAQFRHDRWQSVMFAVMAACSLTEMAQTLVPVPFWGRLHYQLLGILCLSVAISVGFYAERLLDESERSRYRRGVRAYTIFCVLLEAAAAVGLGDHGQRREIVWGVPFSVLAMRGWLVAGCVVYGALLLPVSSKLLLHPDPYRRRLRRGMAVAVFLSPLFEIRECLICAGVWRGLPVGGYIAGLLGIHGFFILIERLRELTGKRTVELGGYRLGERLGAGGMAEVFLAEKRGTGQLAGVVQRVALKRMRPEHAGNPNFAQMFLDEARLAARLHHPHIVTLHDVGTAEGEAYLIMELVEGAALSTLLRAQRGRGLPAHVVVELGVQMSDALAYAHALTDSSTGRPLGLVHRDVSPQNILVARTGVAKLTDFGIARAEGRSTMTATGVLKGKVTYMAPEQMRGESFDHRADLWALGVVLFEAATGTSIYEGLSEPQIIGLAWQNLRPSLDGLDALPEGLAQVLGSLLEPDHKRRPADAAVLHRTLLALRDEAHARDELAALTVEALAAAAPPSGGAGDPGTIAESPHARKIA